MVDFDVALACCKYFKKFKEKRSYLIQVLLTNPKFFHNHWSFKNLLILQNFVPTEKNDLI